MGVDCDGLFAHSAITSEACRGTDRCSSLGTRLSYAINWKLFRRYADGLAESGQPLTIHQLRHTFGSEPAGQMDALILKDVMGHKSLRTTRQYAMVNPEAAKEAFRKSDARRGR
jgi:integrase